MNHVLNHHSWE